MYDEILLDQNFEELSNSDRFKEAQNLVLSEKFTIKDIRISRRVIKHWEDKKILIDTPANKKWRKFNLVEYVWIKIVDQLRNYGFSITKIKKVKSQVLPKLDFHKLYYDPRVRKHLIRLVESHGISLEELETECKEEIMEGLKKTKDRLLEIIILDVIILRSHMVLVIFETGETVPIKVNKLDEYLNNPMYKKIALKSFLVISISDILADFIAESDIKISCDFFKVISKEEAAILEQLRKDCKSVEIVFNKDKRIDKVITTKEDRVNAAKDIAGQIIHNGYQEIIFKTKAGKIVYFENKRSQKIDELVNENL